MWNRKKSVNEETSRKNKNNECDNNKKNKLKFWNLVKLSCENFDKIFENLFGFQLADLSSFEKFVRLLYRPTDPSSLGVTRALFGIIIFHF